MSASAAAYSRAPEDSPVTCKELLIHETIRAYDFEEMSLLTSVYAWKWDGATSTEVRAPENNLTNEMASRRPAYWYRGIVEIIEHAAQCKIMYMTQAYGPPPTPVPASDGTLPSALKQLDAAQTYLLACLDSCTDEQLGRPVPTKCTAKPRPTCSGYWRSTMPVTAARSTCCARSLRSRIGPSLPVFA